MRSQQAITHQLILDSKSHVVGSEIQGLRQLLIHLNSTHLIRITIQLKRVEHL
jgi:hypothetical protein